MLSQHVKNLRSTTSVLDKRRFVKAMFNDKKYGKLMDYMYSPYKTYYIGANAVPNVDADTIEEPTDELFNLLDRLNDRSLSGHDAQRAIHTFAAEHGNLIYLVLKRSLGSGVSYSLLSEAGFNIPKFSVKLAEERKENKGPRRYPLFAQEKYDGVRLLFDTDTKIFYTRSGKTFTSMTMEKWFQGVPKGYMIDGEIILISGVQEDRQVVSGYINKLLNKNYFVPYDTMCFKAFDIIPTDLFYKAEVPKATLMGRYSTLTKALSTTSSPHLQLAYTKLVNSQQEVDDYFEEVTYRGGEGLILKDTICLYDYKRSISWEKLKATYSETFKIIDVLPGSGKYEGLIGALLVENKTLGIKSKVGSGLTDNLRVLDPSAFLGKHIEVLFNTITINDKGEKSLFLPRFKCFRYDYDM